ncbi:MAG: methyltransferase domain-containing protein [candidate division Zixibacteria bacterium]|nr:methyltransferase domain-containing protein [candidate division Zixibacteria bacterium]
MPPDKDYILGTHDEEIDRLALQHRVWRPRALDGWQRAGFTVGKTILDVGCGPGHAAIDLAEIVGPTGKVIAIDRSRRFLDFLESTCANRGLGNVCRARVLQLLRLAVGATLARTRGLDPGRDIQLALRGRRTGHRSGPDGLAFRTRIRNPVTQTHHRDRVAGQLLVAMAQDLCRRRPAAAGEFGPSVGRSCRRRSAGAGDGGSQSAFAHVYSGRARDHRRPAMRPSALLTGSQLHSDQSPRPQMGHRDARRGCLGRRDAPPACGAGEEAADDGNVRS